MEFDLVGEVLGRSGVTLTTTSSERGVAGSSRLTLGEVFLAPLRSFSFF
jgi:hypothetical protein